MNKDVEDLHTLCEEIFPLYDDLSADSQRVLDNHIAHCPICNKSNEEMKSLEKQLFSKDQDTKMTGNIPVVTAFSKLYWVKITGFWVMILFKLVVLSLISQEFIRLSKMTDAPLGLLDEGVRASMLLYYFPLIILTNSLSLFLIRKRWIFVFIIIDLIFFFYLDEILVQFVTR